MNTDLITPIVVFRSKTPTKYNLDYINKLDPNLKLKDQTDFMFCVSVLKVEGPSGSSYIANSRISTASEEVSSIIKTFREDEPISLLTFTSNLTRIFNRTELDVLLWEQEEKMTQQELAQKITTWKQTLST